MADRDDWRTQWLHALGTVVAVAAVIGTVLGGLTYGAVHVTGLAGGEPGAEDPPRRAADAAAARPRPSTPSVSRAEKKTARPERTGATERKAERTADRRADRRPERKAERADQEKRDRAKRRDRHRAAERAKQPSTRDSHLPTLAAARGRVHRMQRVNLHGRYPGHAGTRLVVQRLERGRWQRFPVTVVVRGGGFRTWIASGRPGPNRLRVVDPTTRRASAPVTVTVR